MSWNPFKKAFSTKRTRQDDVELDREVHQLHHVQAVSKRLYKDMRKVTDSESACVKSQTRIGQEVRSSPAGKVNPLRDTVEIVCRISEQLQLHVKDLKSRQDVLFSDPMKRFYNVYKHLDFHIKQREQKQQELDKQLAKLDKRKESLSTGSAKMELTQRKVASAKSDYDRSHQRLTQELPMLYEGRVAFFEPCVTATLQSELLYHRQCVRTLHQIVPSKTENSSLFSSTQQTNRLLDKIKELSIVSAL